MYLAITALEAIDSVRIEAHLLRLAPEDRSRRFSAGLVTDETIHRYVAGIRFGHDVVMGLVSKRGLVVAFVHGCVYQVHTKTHVETAFSVDAEWRGHGFGTRLMEAVQVRASADGGAALVGTCAVRNLPMRRIFEHAGLTLTREEDEMRAYGQVRALGGAMKAAAAA
jgi:GNAT superfamily N-acetyltransferase